jgi:exopolysaccharide biosynthesis polyprenyl glycosylphosphotransferase
MDTFRRQLLIKVFKLSDVLVMALSFALAILVAYYQTGTISFSEFFSMRFKVQNFILFLCFLWVWHQIFFLCGLHNSRRFSRGKDEIIDIIKATSLGTSIIFIAAIFFKIGIINHVSLLIFWSIVTAMTIASRLSLRYVLARIRIRGRNLRYMLIVGTNQRTIKFARRVEREPELGYRLIGFVDQEWAGIADFHKTNYDLSADFDEFPDYIRNHVVDEVVISLPLKSHYQQAARIAALSKEQGIIVRYLSDIFNLNKTQSRAEQFENDPLISYYIGAMNGWQVAVKRGIDIVLSAGLLIVLLPLFLSTAILIRITSSGPVFFVQKRVGLNKRKFRLYKFRTMVDGAEEQQKEFEEFNEVCGPVFKLKNDPRITAVGKILRKKSIDELPQLLNVLKGDMSIVGPRPLPLRDCNGFDKDGHRRRFSVRPGLTCLWQINGRSDISFEKWMEFDMQYIDQWSLWLDLKILVKTIPVVLKGTGAA